MLRMSEEARKAAKKIVDEIVESEPRLKLVREAQSGKTALLGTQTRSNRRSPTGKHTEGGGGDVTRRAIAAAVKTSDGVVHFMPPPHRHHHTVHALNKNEGTIIIAEGEQGFVMSDGTFADREEAGRCAIESGQIAELRWPPRLFSEDLW